MIVGHIQIYTACLCIRMHYVHYVQSQTLCLFFVITD